MLFKKWRQNRCEHNIQEDEIKIIEGVECNRTICVLCKKELSMFIDAIQEDCTKEQRELIDKEISEWRTKRRKVNDKRRTSEKNRVARERDSSTN